MGRVYVESTPASRGEPVPEVEVNVVVDVEQALAELDAATAKVDELTTALDAKAAEAEELKAQLDAKAAEGDESKTGDGQDDDGSGDGTSKVQVEEPGDTPTAPPARRRNTSK